ncbi:hypothetical protein B0H34DRAFT_803599 [Crassisporium funariophilum]|nr:hypothetical protein B0H34DRAFT_803599 [Crassisporium funariophilum]
MARSTLASKTIGQFDSRGQLLRAFYAAISPNLFIEHRDLWLHSGILHGNINLSTIHISNGAAADAPQGFLVYPHHTTQPDPTFQSVMSLSSSVLHRKRILPTDYLDDLESFYYVLAYISIAYTSPHAFLPPHSLPPSLAMWAGDPTSRESVLEKEAMLFGFGMGVGNVAPWFCGFIFEELLDGFHAMLKCMYLRKVDDEDVEHAREVGSEEEEGNRRKEETLMVYERVLGSFELAIDCVEIYEADEERTAATQEDGHGEEEEASTYRRIDVGPSRPQRHPDVDLLDLEKIMASRIFGEEMAAVDKIPVRAEIAVF